MLRSIEQLIKYWNLSLEVKIEMIKLKHYDL
jgi:hypothetical protein